MPMSDDAIRVVAVDPNRESKPGDRDAPVTLPEKVGERLRLAEARGLPFNQNDELSALGLEPVDDPIVLRKDPVRLEHLRTGGVLEVKSLDEVLVGMGRIAQPIQSVEEQYRAALAMPSGAVIPNDGEPLPEDVALDENAASLSLAQKDAEIERLRKQLAEAQTGTPMPTDVDEAPNATWSLQKLRAYAREQGLRTVPSASKITVEDALLQVQEDAVEKGLFTQEEVDATREMDSAAG